MNKLLKDIEQAVAEKKDLPFSVYSSVHEQKLLNVPIAKPLLIFVLSGDKELGQDGEITCHAGSFIFLSDSPSINMRNIPKDNAYFALLIEFNDEDFSGIPVINTNKVEHIIGTTSPILEACLQQFVQATSWAPDKLISSRKQELLQLLAVSGYPEVAAMKGKNKLSQRLHDLFQSGQFNDLTLDYICQHLAMSESTLRRKLQSEGTSVKEIKTRTRLGLGLHLLQTTTNSIGLIAERCGYQSQSRFTERFKSHFGLTPSELRKTKMTD